MLVSVHRHKKKLLTLATVSYLELTWSLGRELEFRKNLNAPTKYISFAALQQNFPKKNLDLLRKKVA